MSIYDPSDKVPLRVQVVDLAGLLTNTTKVTFTITTPNAATGAGIDVTIPTSTGVYDLDVDLTAAPYSGAPGQYVWRAIATGAITGEFDGWFVVRARRTPGPTWTPELDAVGDWIPARTLSSILTPGVETYLGTFTSTTTPTDEQVRRHVDAAVAAVIAECGSVDSSLNDQARAAASCLAASFVELAYPTRDADLTTYDRLTVLAGSMLRSLADANVQVTGAPAGLAQSLLPQYSFPTPPAWGDDNIF